MGFFSSFIKPQLPDVVEWDQIDPKLIFWRWPHQEIKKGSKLIIRPGQDAVFLFNGQIEGVFTKDGKYDIDSEIIPFLSTLKGFMYGFDSAMRAEVLFVNTKQQSERWGTQTPIMLSCPGLPGGLPVRAFGNFVVRPGDYPLLIENIAGVSEQFSVEDVRERMRMSLAPLLIEAVSKSGQNVLDLQGHVSELGAMVGKAMNEQMMKIGLNIVEFNIASFSYPDEVRRMQEKAAGQAMVGDLGRYQGIAVADGFSNPGSPAGMTAAAMMGMNMGAGMGMGFGGMYGGAAGTAGAAGASQRQNAAPGTGVQPAGAAGAQGGAQSSGPQGGSGPNFCPNCGAKVSGSKFFPNCGAKLV